jgi:hypothetical protein
MEPHKNIFSEIKNSFNTQQLHLFGVGDNVAGNKITYENNPVTINNYFIKDGATIEIIDKLLEIVKIAKDGEIEKAQEILRDFNKDNLSNVDFTNIQSTKAHLYIMQGKLLDAKIIYEAILDTGIKSNAVYLGMGNILAAESVKKQQLNKDEAIHLLYESNNWYYKALEPEMDQRPVILVHVYWAIYENFKILTEYFDQNETSNLDKYQKLFEDSNKKAGYLYSINLFN